MSKKEERTYTLTITKDALGQLPAAQFHGETITLVDRIEDVEAAVDELMKSDVIGFDTETRPSFKKGHFNVVSLLQLSTRAHAFLFRLNKIGFHPLLVSLLENPDKLKIGLSIHDDFHNLNKLADLHPENFIDLQHYVKSFKIADNSLTRIYGILFGQRISKSQRLTNWEATELSPAQQSYAALDALACIDVYDYLKAGKFNPDLSEYKEFAPTTEPDDPDRVPVVKTSQKLVNKIVKKLAKPYVEPARKLSKAEKKAAKEARVKEALDAMKRGEEIPEQLRIEVEAVVKKNPDLLAVNEFVAATPTKKTSKKKSVGNTTAKKTTSKKSGAAKKSEKKPTKKTSTRKKNISKNEG